jgi:lipopolysaccharide transport system ATP-binding protein
MIWRKKRFYEELTVLSTVSFEILEGETVGVIGRNGAGKSTLLQIIAGTLQPSEGIVEVKGRVAPLIELGAGFNPEFTGRDNVVVYGQLLGMDQAEIERKYDDIVRFADIGEYIDRPVKTYSSGMYARLAFAVAMHVDPKILIVDEILAVGDAPFQRKCLNRFYEIKETGCTILIVAHDQYLVRSLCDRAIYLKNGQQVAFGPAADVTARYLEDIEPAPIAVPAPATPKGSADGAPVESEDAAAQEVSEAMEVREGIVTEGPEGPATLPAVEPVTDKLFRISSVELLSALGEPVATIHSGDTVRLRMRFNALTSDLPDAISFVFNLYRQDGVYICGTTTLMEGMAPHAAGRAGEVTVTFPDLPLLAGKYHWRVAINDHGGLLVHSEAKGVCPFRVVDNFRSVGVVDLKRSWSVAIQKDGARQIANGHGAA